MLPERLAFTDLETTGANPARDRIMETSPVLVDDLPETPGVYLLHGEDDRLLYVGRGKNLRRGVLAHFASPAGKRGRSPWARETRLVDWRETVGKLGASLLEYRLLADQPSLHNRPLAPPA